MAESRRADHNSYHKDRQKSRQRRLPRVLAVLCCVALLISLIPILAAAFYAHPLNDDYGFSLYVHQALESGGGLFAVLSAGIRKVQEVYLTWQGTFSAVFLFTLQPGVFSDDLYWVTTFLLIGMLAGGTYFLIDTIVVRWAGVRRAWSVVITCAVLLVSIQFVPDKTEAYYWYNGAVYYTVFYALTLILFALTLRMVLADRRGRKLSLGIAACLLAFFIGGGNYSTALFSILVLLIAPPAVRVIRGKDRGHGPCDTLQRKSDGEAGFSGTSCDPADSGPSAASASDSGEAFASGSPFLDAESRSQNGKVTEKTGQRQSVQPGQQRRILCYGTLLYCLIPACVLAALLVSMLAPGNAVRASSMNGMSPIRAVLLSVYYAARYAADWTGLAQLSLFLGLTPILCHLAGKVKCSFPYPVLMILAAFLCYAAMFTPPLYAMRSVGGGRQVDIYYYTYYLVALFSIFYLCGWAVHRNLFSLRREILLQPAAAGSAAALLLAMAAAGCASYGFSSLTTLDTAQALADGTAAAYSEEFEDMLAQIEEGETYVTGVHTVPDFFGSPELTDEENGWVNLRMAQYYGVEYFYLKIE